MPSIENILESAGKALVKDTQKALRGNKINASGDLSRSVKSTVTSNRDITTLEISANSYIFPSVQEGRGPSKKDEGGILRDRIEDWIRDKPIRFNPSEISLDSLVFLITRKIHEEGTEKWKKFGSKGQTSGILESVFSDNKIDQIEAEIVKSVEESFIEGFAVFSNLE